MSEELTTVKGRVPPDQVRPRYRETPHGLLPDWAIAQVAPVRPIEPCAARPGVISYGLSSYGLDVRVADQFKLFSPLKAPAGHIDPKAIDENHFVEATGDLIIPPNHFALGKTVEYFDMPRDLLGLAVGKSSYARCGIIVNITPVEPAWKGYLTVEISNSTPMPVKVYANEGICQILFFRAAAQCDVSYADKEGIYQDQAGLTPARVRR